MTSRLFNGFFILALLTPVFFSVPAHAEGAETKKGYPEVIELENPLGCSEKGLENGTCNEQTGEKDMRILIGSLIQKALGVLGSVTLFVFVAGGFLWLTSAGNSDHIKKGADTMLWAAIGLLVIFGSYAILTTLLNGLTGKGQNTGPTPLAEGCYCEVDDGELKPFTQFDKDACNEIINNPEGAKLVYGPVIDSIQNCQWITGVKN